MTPNIGKGKVFDLARIPSASMAIFRPPYDLEHIVAFTGKLQARVCGDTPVHV